MTIQTQLEELARSKLLGKRIDPVGFVEDLLALSSREGEVHCTCAGDEALRFSVPEQRLVFEVAVDRARGKLRMMCARLSVLCSEGRGQDVSLYGGEGVIDREERAEYPGERANGVSMSCPRLPNSSTDSERMTWRVRFKNTMHEHEFTIQKV